MKHIKYILLSAILIGFTACSDDDNTMVDEPLPELTAGSANLSSYVSLGNSLTAGFTDNALFIAAQQNSFPNTLSQKFALVGGGNFTQPLMNDNVGGFLFGGMQNEQFGPRLFFDGSGPAQLPSTPSTEVFAPSVGIQNNMGVPGAKSFHLLFDGYGNPANLLLEEPLANPYYVRMASAPNATILGDAMAQAPSFFSLWIGNNDVLGYALSGGDGSNPITPVDGPPGVGFNETYGALVATLTSQGAQGVVANIPDVTSIPHFTTVPYNPLDPTNPAFGPQIPTLNGIFGQLNQVFAFLNVPERSIVFSETSASAAVIFDESLTNLSAQITGVLNQSPTFPAFVASFGLPEAAAPQVATLLGLVYGQARQATADDLFVLTSASVIGTVNADSAAFLQSQGLPAPLAAQFSVEGVSLPLADQWVLLPTEQAEIAMATSMYNSTISAVASQAGLALVDANDLLSQVANGGYGNGGYILTSDLVTGGAFSLDGVHPTARGYALIANEIMRAIDATYGSNFEASGNFVDLGDFPTNYSPALQ